MAAPATPVLAEEQLRAGQLAMEYQAISEILLVKQDYHQAEVINMFVSRATLIVANNVCSRSPSSPELAAVLAKIELAVHMDGLETEYLIDDNVIFWVEGFDAITATVARKIEEEDFFQRCTDNSWLTSIAHEEELSTELAGSTASQINLLKSHSYKLHQQMMERIESEQ